MGVPGFTGYAFTNEEMDHGFIKLCDEKKDGFELRIKIPIFDPRDVFIDRNFSSYIYLSLPDDSKEQLIVSKITNEISYNEGKNKIEKRLYLFILGGSFSYKFIPKKINKTKFLVIDNRESDALENWEKRVFQYDSLSEMPEEYRKIPIFARWRNQKEYRCLSSQYIFFIYYDFPRKVDKIKYRIKLEFKKGDKIMIIDKSYDLYKKRFLAWIE